ALRRRGPAAVLVAVRQPRRRAAAADHRLHDLGSGLRPDPAALRRALRLHHLRQPRVGALGLADPPRLDARARGGRAAGPRRGGRGERARLRPVDGRDDRPGARHPLPGARARARAGRNDARWPARRAPDPARARCAGGGGGGRRARAGAPRARADALLTGVPRAPPRPRARAAAPLRRAPRQAAGRLRALVGDRLPRHGLAAAERPGADARHPRRPGHDGAARQRAAARRADPGRRARGRRGQRPRLPARGARGVLRGARGVARPARADRAWRPQRRPRRARRAAHARARAPDRRPADGAQPHRDRGRAAASARPTTRYAFRL
ncbi:MAG: hypothetical protein AVDCRST_MAG30-208, partial [uncultured Solirubrobacteraceae bacterium]